MLSIIELNPLIISNDFIKKFFFRLHPIYNIKKSCL